MSILALRGSYSRRLMPVLAGVAVSFAIACGSGDSPPSSSAVDTFSPATVDVPSDLPPARPTPTPALAAADLIINQAGPELTGTQQWFNSEPTSIGSLVADGKVVLVDFWTYTCINCIRTFPFLRDWHEKYSDRGLVILGVHSPEFEFEKVAENVQAAIERHGLEYPVVQDNDMATWDAFMNRFWPAKYLVDATGEVVYTHFGEGEYTVTERQVRAALEAAGYDVSDIPVGNHEGPERDPEAAGQTRELYGGWGRNYSYSGLYAGQPEYYDQPDQLTFYEDNVPHRNGQWFAQGAWVNTREAMVHGRETENYEDYLAFLFSGRSVNVVINSVGGAEPFKVIIELDGKPVSEEDAGADIEWDEEGKSFLSVDEPREYRVVEMPEWAERELRLRVNSPHFGMFAVTFGSNLSGA